MDVGIATLCVMADKSDPQRVTLEDLDTAAGEMKKYYFGGALSSYLTCVFMNSEYVQPERGTAKAKTREAYARRVLWAHRWTGDPEAEGAVCSFSGERATHVVHRGQVPMLTGEAVLNFFPEGRGGLTVAGPYLTALQALPLGGRRSEGRLLVAHADDPSLMISFARIYLEDNRRLLALAMSGKLPKAEGPDTGLEREHAAFDNKKKQPKFPDAKAPFTLIASDLQRLVVEARNRSMNSSVTIYWLSSSGQGPSLDVFWVPSAVIRFLAIVGAQQFKSSWDRIVGRAWQPVRGGDGSRALELIGAGRSRNAALTDLIRIYLTGGLDWQAAKTFLHRHLLSDLRRKVASGDCDWELTALFLTEVLGMSKERIERIKRFADKLADFIQQRNDRGFFRALVYAQHGWELRNELVKAQRNEFREHQGLLFGLDEYVDVFDAEDAAGVANWSLIRDLISIRLIESLYERKWLTEEILGVESEEQSAALADRGD